jgi:hypothetical protein
MRILDHTAQFSFPQGLVGEGWEGWCSLFLLIFFSFGKMAIVYLFNMLQQIALTKYVSTIERV